MNQLPKQVKVGPITYQVREVDALVDDQVYGQIVRGTSIIDISPRLSPGMRAVTVWHEILHALLRSGGFFEHDEQMVNLLAHGIVGVLQDNPELSK